MQLYSQASTYNTSCFDTNSSSETSQKVRSLQEMFAIEQKKNILGEYFSFFKPRTWNYLHLEGMKLYRNNLHRNDFVLKRPVTIWGYAYPGM